MKFWVLTEAYNDYDQHGVYFLAVWGHKPTIHEVATKIGGNFVLATHVLSGGGRQGSEDQWYNLDKVEEG